MSSNPSGFDAALMRICAKRCAEPYGEPPCWRLPDLVEPCEQVSPCSDCLTARVKELEGECERLNEIINSPENDDFVRGVSIEAEHQTQRWGDDHDKEKNGWDWFWTIGYLSQKAAASFEAGEFEKTQHHCITTAALMKNFHSRASAALKGDAS